MIAVIKNWLPITLRNRVALGFAFAALVVFVIWNALPYYPNRDGWWNRSAACEIWPEILMPQTYVHLFMYLGYGGIYIAVVCVSIILNGLLVLTVIPLWRVLHANIFVRMTLGLMNLGGGVITFYFTYQISDRTPDADDLAQMLVHHCMAIGMVLMAIAFFVFKNELGLRHELEVKRMIGDQNTDLTRDP